MFLQFNDILRQTINSIPLKCILIRVHINNKTEYPIDFQLLWCVPQEPSWMEFCKEVNLRLKKES